MGARALPTSLMATTLAARTMSKHVPRVRSCPVKRGALAPFSGREGFGMSANPPLLVWEIPSLPAVTIDHSIGGGGVPGKGEGGPMPGAGTRFFILSYAFLRIRIDVIPPRSSS